MAAVQGVEPAGIESASRYPPTRQALFACSLLFLGYTLAFVDRNIVSLLVVPIEHDLGLDDVQMGLLQGTAFAIFYSVFGLPIAWAIDRFARRGILTAGIGVWSAMTCLTGLSGGFVPFFLARVGVGAGEATILPGATSLLADYFRPAARGRALGVFASGIYIGAATALIGGGAILHRLHGRVLVLPVLGPLQPWQLVLVAAGSLGIPLAAATLFMREPARRHARTAAGARRRAPGLRELFREHPRAIAAHFTGFTAMAFASYGATAWLPTLFIREYAWTPSMVGVRLGMIALLAGPLGSYAGGHLADMLEKAGQRDGKLLVGALAAACTCVPAVLLGLSQHAMSTFAAAAVVVFCTSLVWGVAPAALQEIVHGAVLARATAIYTALLNLIALGLGPPSVALLGQALGHGNRGLGLAMAIVVPAACIVALLAFMASRPAYRRARAGLASLHTEPRGVDA